MADGRVSDLGEGFGYVVFYNSEVLQEDTGIL